MSCPRCQSTNTVKNGRTHYGKQRFKCADCERQFVDSPTRQPVTQSTRELIDKLLLERLSRFSHRPNHWSNGSAGCNITLIRSTTEHLNRSMQSKKTREIDNSNR